MRVAALLASHNRRESTLASLDALFAQQVPVDVHVSAILMDDGSSDGTADAVRARHPQVEVMRGSGALFWARSMAKAEEAALRRAPDCLLWLNDDVVLDRDALARLLSVAAHSSGQCIVVGAVRDPKSGAITYSGLRRTGLHPLRVERVEPQGRPVAVAAFNGNVVLVPRQVRALIGSIDSEFEHALADLDYGFRATRSGIEVLLAPEAVGTCPANSSGHAWLSPTLSPADRLRVLFGPKGIPARPLAHFLRRHARSTWFFWWGATYLKHVPRALVAGARTPRRRYGAAPTSFGADC
jgi:GT2 family glycosyltransferase